MAARKHRPAHGLDCFRETPEPFLASADRDRIDIGEDPLVTTADSGEAVYPCRMRLPQPLAILPLLERKCGMDAGFEATQGDAEHLCKIWAEVGRAVLMRRGQNLETDQG